MITIIDYGMGNLGSIKNMLKKIGVASEITSDKREIMGANKLILPGVGAFDRAMKNLEELDLIGLIRKRATEENIPILGICLGMQMLGSRSEEGVLEGLDLIPGKVVKFQLNNGHKIPHMGWNYVQPVQQSILFSNVDPEMRYYFVHSYHFVCDDAANSMGTSSYGINFTSVIQRKNIYGTQFHPEKSHRFGMQLLKNFVELS